MRVDAEPERALVAAGLCRSAAIQVRQGRELLRLAPDDGQGQRQAEGARANDGSRRSTDGDPEGEGALHRAGIDAATVDGRGMASAGPGEDGALADGQEHFELLGKQRIIVGEVVAEEGKLSMKEPRPAMISARPLETRSRVANCWNTRTGSSELSTVTALDSRIAEVLAAAAPRSTAGAEIA